MLIKSNRQPIRKDSLEKKESINNSTCPYELEVLTPSQRRLIAYLFSQYDLYRSHTESLESMAFKLQVNEKTIRRSFTVFKTLGFLTWVSGRSKKIRNVYYFKSLLFDPLIQQILRNWVRYFSIIALTVLLSTGCESADVQLKKERGIINHGSRRVTIVNGENYTLLQQEAPSFIQQPPHFFSQQGEKVKKPEQKKEAIITALQKKIPFTSKGRDALRQLPYAALVHIESKVYLCLSKEEPHRYLFKVANNYCKEHALIIERNYQHPEHSTDSLVDMAWLERHKENLADRLQAEASPPPPLPPARAAWIPEFVLPSAEEVESTKREFIDLPVENVFQHIVRNNFLKNMIT